MALELLKEPVGGIGNGPDAGMFTLPPEFDQQLHAAEWVDEGQVEMKKQRQHLPQTGLTADGWELFKKAGKPVCVSLSKGRKFYLMFRPRAVQDQVNAAYGNVSKELLRREVRGESLTSPDGRQVQGYSGTRNINKGKTTDRIYEYAYSYAVSGTAQG
jgi:hypothetical protein